MVEISQKEFEQIVTESVNNLPQRYLDNMKNVGFVVEGDPSPAQRQKMKLEKHQSLFGLYEGIPLTQRGTGYNLVLPDKITIFQNPLSQVSSDVEDLKKRVHHTVWHEVAHHFGLEHSRIYDLEAKHRRQIDNS
jgi:predicted Zn-dependent protease with MMP-like domain